MQSSPEIPAPDQLRHWLGNIDVYFFDQLLKGRITPGMRVLDAGCGGGRNLTFLLRAGVEVYGFDADPTAVQVIQEQARQLAPDLPRENFQVGNFDAVPFPPAHFDFLIANAVLHYAKSGAQFASWGKKLYQLLRPGGILFIRTAGFTGREGEAGAWEFTLSNGQKGWLSSQKTLLDLSAEWGAELLEPVKTVNVQDMRAMHTWVLKAPLT